MGTPFAQLVQCSLRGERYGFDASLVTRVSTGDRMQPDPSPIGRLGWYPEGDSRLPVYDLGALVGSPAPAGTQPAQVLRLESPQGAWMIGADTVTRVTKIAAESYFALPDSLTRRLRAFSGLVRLEQEWCLYVNAARFHPETGVFAAQTGALWRTAPRTGSLKSIVPPAGPVPAPDRLFFFSLPDCPNLVCALLPMQVIQVLPFPALVALPGAGADMPGLLPWRDQLVPVLDLRKRWDLPLTPGFSENVKLLVAQGSHSTTMLALPVDGRVSVGRLPQQTTVGSLADFSLSPAEIRGVFETDLGRLVVPDLDELFR
ncbi:MAG: chemotaxis protein CheW [Blastocatellia bacterium]|nr:chemotaxis protein CheW [Blastocatellia bacterium]